MLGRKILQSNKDDAMLEILLTKVLQSGVFVATRSFLAAAG